jgi:competence protein ComEC
MFSQGKNHYLFTGDLEKSGEESLVASNNLPKVKLYKAGHHGSKTSSNTSLMSVIQPEIVCVCCCAGSSEFNAAPLNTFPTQDFINRVAPYTDKIYVTSLSVSYSGNQTVSMNGNITVSSLGKEVTVTCSNNDIILKETEWFKANRTWPTNGV